MKARKLLVGIGITVSIFGIVFFLQGQSIVGPKTSFMYSNPRWVINGEWIVIVGMIILVVGMLLPKINSRFPKS